LSDSGFESLVAQHSQDVLNLALRVLRNANAAQDVHQEVFMAIWRRWHHFNGQVNWSAYLYRTTVRKSLEFARQSRKHAFSDQEFYPDQLAGKSAPPDGEMKIADFRKKLIWRLAKLPPRQADVFVLSRIEGLPHKQIAQILSCSEGTVKSHLHRAMKRLAHELSEFLDNG